jgi:hypothetical protein
MPTSLIYAFLIALWAAVATAVFLIEFARWHVILRIRKPGKAGKIEGLLKGSDRRYYYPLNRKPFNCEACLPVWLVAVFLPFAIYKCTLIISGVALAFTAGIVTPIVIKQIHKQ